MDLKPKTSLRMRDCALALQVAHSHNQSLNRLRLQKFIYLMDVLSSAYETFSIRDGHKTYYNGPYDPAIQNAVDSLIFRGFARAHGVLRTNDNRIYAQYSITEAGLKWVADSAAQGWMAPRARIALRIAENVNSCGWEKLKALVYAEPTYVAAKKSGFGSALNSKSSLLPTATKVFELIRATLSYGFCATKPNPISPEFLTDLFFRYLMAYGIEAKTKELVGE